MSCGGWKRYLNVFLCVVHILVCRTLIHHNYTAQQWPYKNPIRITKLAIEMAQGQFNAIYAVHVQKMGKELYPWLMFKWLPDRTDIAICTICSMRRNGCRTVCTPWSWNGTRMNRSSDREGEGKCLHTLSCKSQWSRQCTWNFRCDLS